MAIYAGETVRVFAAGSDWDGTPLGPAQTDEVSVYITDVVGTLIETSLMAWSPEESRWRFDWSSPAVAGPYSIEVTFSTPEGISIDVRRVTLEAPRPDRPLLRPLVVRV